MAGKSKGAVAPAKASKRARDEEDEDEEEEEEAPKAKKASTATKSKKPAARDDDDDDEEEAPAKKTSTKTAKASKNGKAAAKAVPAKKSKKSDDDDEEGSYTPNKNSMRDFIMRAMKRGGTSQEIKKRAARFAEKAGVDDLADVKKYKNFDVAYFAKFLDGKGFKMEIDEEADTYSLST